MSQICVHCILNTNATNIINLTLDITHIPHRYSFRQVIPEVEDIVTFRRSELPVGCGSCTYVVGELFCLTMFEMYESLLFHLYYINLITDCEEHARYL